MTQQPDRNRDREAPDLPVPVSVSQAQDAVARMIEEARAAQEAGEAPAVVDDETRAQQEAVGCLYQLGFEDAALHPKWEQIPAEWSGTLRAYTSSIAAYAANGQAPYFGASTGRGKTCAMALVALAAWKAGVKCAYVRCGDDLVWTCEQKASRQQAWVKKFDFDGDMNEVARNRWPYMVGLERMDLLLLDDLDLLKGTGFDPEREAWDVVARFLYARMAEGLATGIGSNLPFEDVVDKKAADPATGKMGKVVRQGLTSKPGMARVASRWQVRIPPELRMMTNREDQRGL